MLNKKEGNITRANSSNCPNLASQAGREAGAHLPPGEGSNLMAQATQSGRHSPSSWGRRQFISGRQSGFPGSLLPSQVLTFPRGRKQLSGTGHSVRQAGRCSPSPWGRRQFISYRQSFFPGLPGSYFPARCSPSPQQRKQFSSISGRQSGFPGLPGRQASNFP